MDEQPRPGVGYRYDLHAEGGPVSVVVHHSGRRDVYVHTGRPGEPPVVVTLDEDQARRLGSVLAGPSGLVIESVTLGLRSPSAGRSIADLAVRRRTGMSIVAIVRGDETRLAPGPDEVLFGGDRLIVVGRPEHLDALVAEIT